MRWRRARSRSRPFFAEHRRRRRNFQERHRRPGTKNSISAVRQYAARHIWASTRAARPPNLCLIRRGRGDFWTPFYAAESRAIRCTVAKRALIANAGSATASAAACGWRFWQPAPPGTGRCCFHAGIRDSVSHRGDGWPTRVRRPQVHAKDASFILDIGGQDMKAIWLDTWRYHKYCR